MLNDHDELMRHWKRLFPDRIYTLNYQQLVNNPDTSATEEDLKVSEYADLLMNLIRRHFTSSSSPILNAVSPTEISTEFVKFIDSVMYQSMLDTSASGKNLGFSEDPKILKPKLLKKVKA